MSYNSEFRRSIDQRDDFWREQAQHIDWIKARIRSGAPSITAMANGFRTVS